MIGMNQIKKKFLLGMFIGAIIGLVGIAAVLWYSSTIIKSYQDGTNEKFKEEYTAEVITFTRDVVQGEKITADMITKTRVHINMLPSNAASEGTLVNRIAKYNIPAKATATNSMVADEIILPDERIYEFSSVNLPTNARVGDYVDIKYKIPSGIEYIVLPQVQLLDISGTNIWLQLTEAELLQLNSAIIDSYITPGSVLYAVQYADSTIQIKIDEDKDGDNLPDNATNAKLYIRDKLASAVYSLGENPTSDELVDLLTTYALEYRYYVDAYSQTRITYQPNDQVMEFMQLNRDILDAAKSYLSAEARRNIEDYIVTFESQYETQYSDIISGIETSVSQQQSLRASNF